jgi:hypothetical protein
MGVRDPELSSLLFRSLSAYSIIDKDFEEKLWEISVF